MLNRIPAGAHTSAFILFRRDEGVVTDGWTAPAAEVREKFRCEQPHGEIKAKERGWTVAAFGRKPPSWSLQSCLRTLPGRRRVRRRVSVFATLRRDESEGELGEDGASWNSAFRHFYDRGCLRLFRANWRNSIRLIPVKTEMG